MHLDFMEACDKYGMFRSALEVVVLVSQLIANRIPRLHWTELSRHKRSSGDTQDAGCPAAIRPIRLVYRDAIRSQPG
jgi:hypothetical protein